MGKSYGIQHNQRRAIAPTEQHQLRPAQVLTNTFHIVHRVHRGVLLALHKRRGLAAATLVEEDDVVEMWVKHTQLQHLLTIALPTRTTVHTQNRHTVWVAVMLEVEAVGRMSGHV